MIIPQITNGFRWTQTGHFCLYFFVTALNRGWLPLMDSLYITKNYTLANTKYTYTNLKTSPNSSRDAARRPHIS